MAVGSGFVWVADTANQVIRRVWIASAEAQTLAGSAGLSGTNNGLFSAARFNNPSGVAVDSGANTFVAGTSFFRPTDKAAFVAAFAKL